MRTSGNGGKDHFQNDGEPRDRPSTMLWCDNCGEYVLRSRRHDHDRESLFYTNQAKEQVSSGRSSPSAFKTVEVSEGFVGEGEDEEVREVDERETIMSDDERAEEHDLLR